MKWTQTKRRESQTFAEGSSSEPTRIITITKTGFNDLYSVNEEDAEIGIAFGYEKSFSKEEIKEQFNIDISF